MALSMTCQLLMPRMDATRDKAGIGGLWAASIVIAASKHHHHRHLILLVINGIISVCFSEYAKWSFRREMFYMNILMPWHVAGMWAMQYILSLALKREKFTGRGEKVRKSTDLWVRQIFIGHNCNCLSCNCLPNFNGFGFGNFHRAGLLLRGGAGRPGSDT